MPRNIISNEPIAKAVTPVKTGVQCFCNALKFLDSGFRRNDTLCNYTTIAITSNLLIFKEEDFISPFFLYL
jgi:hypothetical protein